MNDENNPITERDWALIGSILSTLLELTIRPLYTELTALSATVEAMKKAQPHLTQKIELALDFARHSEDTKRSVDQRIAEFSKTLQSLDQPNRGRALEDLLRQVAQTNRVN